MSANIPVVGIVGGIGAGKSSVVRGLKDLRLLVIDADRIGHELLSHDDIRQQICLVFGKDVLDPSGQIDRAMLASEVFGADEERVGNRNRLNEILHPAIRKKVIEQIQQAPHDVDAIILDAALLLEAGWADQCHAIIFIDTPLELRQQRVAETRGWSAEELHRREASQWSTTKKRSYAHYVVDNSGTLTAAAQQMQAIFTQILQQKLIK